MKEDRDIRYMQEALREAQQAYDEDEVPVGAVIVYKDKIIARAHNQIKTLKDPTAHAEMIAVTQAASYLQNERLNDTTMYVTIEPCSMCMGALILARVKRLVYAADDKKAGACGSVINLSDKQELNHRIKIKRHILKEESKRLIQEFFKKKRNKIRFSLN